MWKIFLTLYIGVFIFLPLQALGEGLCEPAAFGELKLSAATVRALNTVGVRGVRDLRDLTERRLRNILRDKKVGNSEARRNVVKSIKRYLSSRGQSLARDFLVDDVGLSVQAANDLGRKGIHDLEGLRKLTEQQLSGIFRKGNNASKRRYIKKIQEYLSSIDRVLSLKSS